MPVARVRRRQSVTGLIVRSSAWLDLAQSEFSEMAVVAERVRMSPWLTFGWHVSAPRCVIPLGDTTQNQKTHRMQK